MSYWVDALDAPATVPHPRAVAALRALNERCEGVVSHMYLDVRGLVTTGIGNLIDPMPLALALPWQQPDGTPAGHDEIVADWLRVKAMPPALVAHRYASPDSLRLDAEAIDALVSRQVAADARELARHFADLYDYPWQAQAAILSMAWALGAGFASGWPRFSAAVRRRDWAEAASECAISTRGNGGVRPRNEANRELLRQAAEDATT